jgi:hypothetical protein
MSTPGLSTNPGIAYRSYGSTRPEAEVLQDFAVRLNETFARPFSRLVLADVLIDLAMQQPDQAQQAIERSEEALRSIIDDTERMQPQKYDEQYRPFLACLPVAALRLGELPSWREAATATQVSTNYEGFTIQAFQACRFAPISHTGIEGYLAEGIPILLGHRAQALYGTGWLARLALAREDQSSHVVESNNPNWDLGVASDTTASSYDKPAKRIQMKNKKANAAATARYEECGVIVLNARSLGFKAATNVIASCMQELDPDAIASGIDTSAFLSTTQLDDLTGKLAEAIGVNTDGGRGGT